MTETGTIGTIDFIGSSGGQISSNLQTATGNGEASVAFRFTFYVYVNLDLARLF